MGKKFSNLWPADFRIPVSSADSSTRLGIHKMCVHREKNQKDKRNNWEVLP